MLSWIESQPTSVIALIVFGAAYLSSALIFCIAALLSRHAIAKALQPVTPGLLSPLGTILGILIAFLAVRVWSNLDHAQEHIGREVTALREAVLLANSLPQDVRARVREAIGKHLDAIASEEWPAMAEERMNLRSSPRTSRRRWARSSHLRRSAPISSSYRTARWLRSKRQSNSGAIGLALAGLKSLPFSGL